jgi:hypothetical protein
MAVIVLGFTSCKDENRRNKNSWLYVVYVDSLENVARDAKANWSSIEATYEVRSSQAETALSDLKGSEDAKAKVEASKTKYAALSKNTSGDASCSAKF